MKVNSSPDGGRAQEIMSLSLVVLAMGLAFAPMGVSAFLWIWARWLGNCWHRRARHLGTFFLTVGGFVALGSCTSAARTVTRSVGLGTAQKASLVGEAISSGMNRGLFLGAGLLAAGGLVLGPMTVHHRLTRRRGGGSEPRGPYR